MALPRSCSAFGTIASCTAYRTTLLGARLSSHFATLRQSVRFTSSKGGSSSRYLARQKRDPFVRARDQSALEEHGTRFVSRSSFKLQQLNQAYHFLGPKKYVVDLGAAPGGWTQVALLAGSAHVFALDILPLSSLVLQQDSGKDAKMRLTMLQGDFREQAMHDKLHSAIASVRDVDTNDSVAGSVDVIVSDMMANTSGNLIRDSVASLDLLEAAFNFARKTLRVIEPSAATAKTSSRGAQSSVLVLKYFEGTDAQHFKKDVLIPNFARVMTKKVAASRSESSEMYFVCFDLKPRNEGID